MYTLKVERGRVLCDEWKAPSLLFSGIIINRVGFMLIGTPRQIQVMGGLKLCINICIWKRASLMTSTGSGDSALVGTPTLLSALFFSTFSNDLSVMATERCIEHQSFKKSHRYARATKGASPSSNTFSTFQKVIFRTL